MPVRWIGMVNDKGTPYYDYVQSIIGSKNPIGQLLRNALE